MKNINNLLIKIKNSKYIGYLLVIILSCIFMAPIFSMDLSQNSEYRIHMSRVLAINSVIKDGIFPPIIASNFMRGFGYALNLFYGPITTYVPIILLNIFGNSGLAIKIFAFFTVIFSGYTMYHFIFGVTKRKSIATLGALIYISAPYKLSNIFDRGAVGEYTAFIFIPLVFEGIYKIINDNKNSYILCIGIIGLVLTHTISAIYTAIFAIVFLILNLKKIKNFKVWKYFLINIFIALLICMFYVVPLLEHKMFGDYVIFNKLPMKTGVTDVYEATIGIKDLFANEFGDQEIRFSIGMITIILIIIGFFCYKKIDKSFKRIYTQFYVLAILSLVMCTRIFPWTLLPDFFGVIQFAWRNLGYFSFFISLVCAINVITFAEQIIKNYGWKDAFIFLIITSIMFIGYLGNFRDWKFDNLKNEKNFDSSINNNEKLEIYRINRDYMPIKAFEKQQYFNTREDCSYILKGNATIVNEDKNKLKDTIVLKNDSDDTIIELPYLYYLGYEVICYNNNQIQYKESYSINVQKLQSFESENGFLAINVPEGDITVIVKYTGTIAMRIAYYISSMTMVSIIVIFTKKLIKNHSKKE